MRRTTDARVVTTHKVKIATINQCHLDVRAAQRLGSVETTESATNDDNLMRLIVIHGLALHHVVMTSKFDTSN